MRMARRVPSSRHGTQRNSDYHENEDWMSFNIDESHSKGISAPWQTSLDIYETLSEPLRVLPRLGSFSLYQDPLLLRD